MTQVSIESPAVLVVDDNPLIVNVLRSLLSSQGYQVFTSNNGEEALDTLRQKFVDVIVCDVMMPKMDGYELHHVIRQKPEFSHIPFVFLTALSDDQEISRGHETGVDAYVVKPFDPRDLLAMVKGKVMRSRNLKNLSEERYDSYRKRVIHTLSHEFRTPLVAINTGTELLIEQHSHLDTNRIKGLLEAIQRGGQRLERLVNDFMLLQQVQAGVAAKLYEVRAATRRVSELITTFEDCKKATLTAEGFSLSIQDSSADAEVHVYEPQIQDILARFLSNAMKFKGQELQIELHSYRQDNEVVIEMRDRGIGMDVAKVKEAVDIFGQIDRDKLEQQGGGLGLAIANRYAAINKGRLEFENRPGGGSIVSLILPVQASK